MNKNLFTGSSGLRPAGDVRGKDRMSAFCRGRCPLPGVLVLRTFSIGDVVLTGWDRRQKSVISLATYKWLDHEAQPHSDHSVRLVFHASLKISRLAAFDLEVCARLLPPSPMSLKMDWHVSGFACTQESVALMAVASPIAWRLIAPLAQLVSWNRVAIFTSVISNTMICAVASSARHFLFIHVPGRFRRLSGPLLTTVAQLIDDQQADCVSGVGAAISQILPAGTVPTVC